VISSTDVWIDFELIKCMAAKSVHTHTHTRTHTQLMPQEMDSLSSQKHEIERLLADTESKLANL
jgi:hypothetical protein